MYYFLHKKYKTMHLRRVCYNSSNTTSFIFYYHLFLFVECRERERRCFLPFSFHARSVMMMTTKNIITRRKEGMQREHLRTQRVPPQVMHFLDLNDPGLKHFFKTFQFQSRRTGLPFSSQCQLCCSTIRRRAVRLIFLCHHY